MQDPYFNSEINNFAPSHTTGFLNYEDTMKAMEILIVDMLM